MGELEGQLRREARAGFKEALADVREKENAALAEVGGSRELLKEKQAEAAEVRAAEPAEIAAAEALLNGAPTPGETVSPKPGEYGFSPQAVALAAEIGGNGLTQKLGAPDENNRYNHRNLIYKAKPTDMRAKLHDGGVDPDNRAQLRS